MMAHPGKKLLFMGQEFAQSNEWNFKTGLDWDCLQNPENRTMQEFSEKLNRFYLENSALWANDDSWDGFSWIANDDYQQSVIAFRRIGDDGEEIVVVCNFVPVSRSDYKVGVPFEGRYRLVFNSDDKAFGGSGIAKKTYTTVEESIHGFDQCISLELAPLSVVYLKGTPAAKKRSTPRTTKRATSKNESTTKTSKTKKTTAVSKKATSKATKSSSEE
jgi:1,4-alpha-glucan branching enzyme